jgi:hypothetical protein
VKSTIGVRIESPLKPLFWVLTLSQPV